MPKRFGTADKWFTSCLALAALGGAMLTGAGFSGAWEEVVAGLRAAGVALLTAGLVVAVLGFLVWRYNLRQEVDTTVILAGTSSSEDEWRAELSAKRDALEVEKAGLKPALHHPVAAYSQFSLHPPSAVDMEARAALERARKREEQINTELRAIDSELRLRLKESKKGSSHHGGE